MLKKNVVCQLKNAQKMLTVTVQNSWETKPTGKVVRAPRKSERDMLLPAQDEMKSETPTKDAVERKSPHRFLCFFPHIDVWGFCSPH